MRGYATAGEIEQYRRDGFVVLPDVLDPAEVTAWRATLSQAVARREGRLPEPGTRYAEFFHREHEYYDRVFTQKINLWKTDDAVRPLVLSPDLGRIAAGLSGSSGARVYLDQALVKEPYGNPTAFHVDVPFWAFTSADALTIWIAMDDATLQNGCLGYIPGSQREQRFDNADIGPELGALFAVYSQWKDVEPVFCPVPAGSAVAHNGLTAHGAGANMTPRQRFAMTVAYMPDGAVFNGQQDIYTAEEAARLRIGDQLADPALNPLVYPAAGLDPMPPSLGFTMSVSPATDAMKPDFQCVTAHSKPDFMASWQARGAQIAVLAVPVLTESGSRGSRARQ